MRNFFLVLFVCSGLLFADIQSLRLADQSEFAFWDDETVYEKVYHVNLLHPDASDDNPGTLNKPLMTINRAAQLVQAREKVVVHAGIYREKISPMHSGTSPQSMIAFEAAPGEKVIVKGSHILESQWQRSVDPGRKDAAQHYSQKLWQTKLSSDFFPEGNPFLIPNANQQEIEAMPWAVRWIGRQPYTLSRGLVFQDGRRLTQLGLYEDLHKFPGTFWVDVEKSMLHVHPFGSYAPETSVFEMTVHQQIFRPEKMGRNYIKVDGFIFEHAANGFPRIGTGAVYVNNGHHWIIQNNTVRQVNSVGIETGARTVEYRSAEDETQERQRGNSHPGGFIVRNNHVYECGTGGIQGHTVRYSLLANNHIHHIGWQDVEQYWECAGIKWLINEYNLVVGNHVHHIESASAIWLDWDNKYSRVTRNVIHDIAPNHNGAIFIEASKKSNLIDHNIIWNADCIAVSLYDSDNTTVVHNLIGNTRAPFSARINTDRSVGGEKLTSVDNVISHNIFYNIYELPVIQSDENVCNANIYVDQENLLDLTQWFQKWEALGMVEDFQLDFKTDSQELIWQLSNALQHVSQLDGFYQDFHYKSRPALTTPGPFQFNAEDKLSLLLKWH